MRCCPITDHDRGTHLSQDSNERNDYRQAAFCCSAEIIYVTYVCN